MTSVKLVRRAQTGDPQAQAELYESLYKRVYYLALRMTRRAEDAEDATQETFLSAFRALPNLTDPNAFEGWLFQIAANQCRKLLRKDSRLTDLPEDEDGRTMLDDLPDEDEGLIPASAVEKESERQIILELIEALPEEQRQCVYLFYYAQMSVKQIAETLGCTEGTVKSRLNYARKKLQAAVLATEERDGIRLHSLAPLGLLLLKDFQLSTAGITAAALGGAGAAGAAGAAGTGGGAAATTATTAKTGLLATVKAKVIAGVTAAAVAVGGGAAILSQSSGPEPLDFADPAMEQNFRVVLDKPEGDLYAEDLEGIYTVYLFDDGIAVEQAGVPVYESAQAPEEGTVAVENLADLALIPGGLMIINQTADPALLDTLVPMDNVHTIMHLNEAAPLEDLSFLQKVPNAIHIALQTACSMDLSALNQCSAVERLMITSTGNITVSTDDLDNLFELMVMSTENGTVDIQSTESLENLRVLSVYGNGLKDLEFLSAIPGLESCDLPLPDGADLSILGSLQHLRILSLVYTGESPLDLAVLSQCTDLEACLIAGRADLVTVPDGILAGDSAVDRYNEISMEIQDDYFRDLDARMQAAEK